MAVKPVKRPTEFQRVIRYGGRNPGHGFRPGRLSPFVCGVCGVHRRAHVIANV